MWAAVRSFIVSRVTALTMGLLVVALCVNVWVAVTDAGSTNVWFEWSAMVVGATGGFLIVKLVIQAHEAKRWLLFRQYMAWDLHNAMVGLISLYESNAEFLQPRQRRMSTHDVADYFQTADAPVILRRFRAELDRRRSEVRNVLSLGMVGITHDTASMIATFKSKYDHLYNLTLYLIDADEVTGPTAPDLAQEMTARSAAVSLFETDTAQPAEKSATNRLKAWARGIGSRSGAKKPRSADARVSNGDEVGRLEAAGGPFLQLLTQVVTLARQVQLEVDPGASPAESIVYPPLDASRGVTEQFKALHAKRVKEARRLDRRLETCARHTLKDI